MVMMHSLAGKVLGQDGIGGLPGLSSHEPVGKALKCLHGGVRHKHRGHGTPVKAHERDDLQCDGSTHGCEAVFGPAEDSW
eukprot:1159221-Pelagomonas_calceolata.AAC.10